jgi:hypothetical protein
MAARHVAAGAFGQPRVKKDKDMGHLANTER